MCVLDTDSSNLKYFDSAADDTKTDATSTKESPIPSELAAVVEALKTMIKEEKSVSSEISHTTDKGIKQVKEDTEALKQMVSGITSTLQNNRSVKIIFTLACMTENIPMHLITSLYFVMSKAKNS